MAIAGLSPNQLYQFQGQRNAYGQNLSRSKAGSVYAQQLGNLKLNRDKRNFGSQWDARRTALPTSYLQRGLGRSGIYQGALQNYARERASGLSDLLLNHQLSQAGLIFQDRGYEDDYAQQMADNYARQYATQADIASALRGVL